MLNRTGNCGIRIIDGLDDTAELTVARVYNYESFGDIGAVLFNDNDDWGYGLKLASFIQRNKLGKIKKTGWFVNPNSGNNIQSWTWIIDHSTTYKWYGKNLSKLEAKYDDLYGESE
jgi:hypothetical protein